MSTVPDSLPRITYVVLAHTHPEQLARMVGALSFENVRFLIHIERNAAMAPFLASVPPSPSVEYIKPREDGHWGGSGIVRATLHGVRAALCSPGGPPPDFVGLVSGLDTTTLIASILASALTVQAAPKAERFDGAKFFEDIANRSGG